MRSLRHKPMAFPRKKKNRGTMWVSEDMLPALRLMLSQREREEKKGPRRLREAGRLWKKKRNKNEGQLRLNVCHPLDPRIVKRPTTPSCPGKKNYVPNTDMPSSGARTRKKRKRTSRKEEEGSAHPPKVHHRVLGRGVRKVLSSVGGTVRSPNTEGRRGGKKNCVTRLDTIGQHRLSMGKGKRRIIRP